MAALPDPLPTESPADQSAPPGVSAGSDAWRASALSFERAVRAFATRAPRRVLILAGWALSVYVIWAGVPFVAVFAVGQLDDVAAAPLGELIQRTLTLIGFVAVAGVPALLAWFLTLLTGGRARDAAVLATLISVAYVATAPTPPGPFVPEPLLRVGGVAVADEPLGPFAARDHLLMSLLGFRDIAYAFLSLVLSWAFAFSLGVILLLAEPLPAEPRFQFMPSVESAPTY